MIADRLASSTLDPDSFRAIAELAYRESGLTLADKKATMIQSRLRHRLRALGLPDFPSYCRFIQSDRGQDEHRHLISALTTNVSHFFRESHHFDTLRDLVAQRLPSLRAGGSLRIWSAGCSNGQEPLSIAMTLLDQAPDMHKLDLRILATDIDPNVVRFARAGIYPERLMNGVPDAMRARYFTVHQDDKAGEPCFAARPELKALIRYNPLNLLKPWPMKSRFDAIFCRNVVIYFDLETQCTLWPRLHQMLHKNGVLFLGHSERIAPPEAFGFRVGEPTTYHPN
ncbi:Chemotaxis protein methyltransferase [Sulfitobacter sp. THAF37]|uniref:CheR family methyltransferase n=1 Tax=Sulfitobacter sp. THAF37 TaxID=2587855 RepID=UPI0012A83FB3|nr:protein-glutamate O-methyltransferase [Sulfitobacter sp. THAF37]QFT59961.1 Chemotaxis protein methyltransferase [Sulfitobacter sp. THAF37]